MFIVCLHYWYSFALATTNSILFLQKLAILQLAFKTIGVIDWKSIEINNQISIFLDITIIFMFFLIIIEYGLKRFCYQSFSINGLVTIWLPYFFNGYFALIIYFKNTILNVCYQICSVEILAAKPSLCWMNWNIYSLNISTKVVNVILTQIIPSPMLALHANIDLDCSLLPLNTVIKLNI